MKNHFFTLLAVLLTALLTLPACSDSESPTPPGPGPDEPVSATFTHALTLKYYGNKYGNDAGNYLLELTTADGSQSLTLDFTASALTDNPSSPQPEAGDYVLAAAGARTGMTFDGGASDWVVTEGMQETRYRFTGGSFSLSRDGADYALKGSFTAGDNRFECTYDGPLTFENCSDDEIDPEAIVCLGAYGTYYGHFYCPEAYDYYLVIFDTKHTQTGDPYNYRIALDFHSLAPVGDRMPQEGTYPIDAELVFDPGTMVPGHLNENWGIDGSYWSYPRRAAARPCSPSRRAPLPLPGATACTASSGHSPTDRAMRSASPMRAILTSTTTPTTRPSAGSKPTERWVRSTTPGPGRSPRPTTPSGAFTSTPRNPGLRREKRGITSNCNWLRRPTRNPCPRAPIPSP